LADNALVDQWIPAFAGMTILERLRSPSRSLCASVPLWWTFCSAIVTAARGGDGGQARVTRRRPAAGRDGASAGRGGAVRRRIAL